MGGQRDILWDSRCFKVVTVLPPGVLWRMPLCCVYLLISIKSGVLDFAVLGMIKKVIHFNDESPTILQNGVDTDISFTYLSSFSNKSTNSFVVLINDLQKLGAFHRDL